MESEPEIINLESTCTVCRFRPDGSFLFKALDELGNLGIGKTLTLAQVPGPNGVEGKCITQDCIRLSVLLKIIFSLKLFLSTAVYIAVSFVVSFASEFGR